VGDRRRCRRLAAGQLGCALVLLLVPPARTEPEPGFRTLFGPTVGPAVDAALVGAARRLKAPDCRRVLEAYQDRSGRTLAQVLDERDLTADAQLRLIVFAEGHGQAGCRRRDVLAVTEPGSRLVYVCGTRFWILQERHPARAEAVLIHELLHSLGLAEDPPTSRAVTDRVLSFCGS